MTNPDYTHLTLVVDRSGSMADIRDDAQGGIATLLTEQFAEPGKLTVTVVEFDNEFDDVARMATEPFGYTLQPRGGTALLDAVGREIARTGADLSALAEDERPGKVVFVVVTDGHENQSSEFTVDTVRAEIERHRTQFAWQFQFIGADETAWQGEALGMRSTRFRKSAKSTSEMYSLMNTNMKKMRSFEVDSFEMPDEIDEDGEGTA